MHTKNTEEGKTYQQAVAEALPAPIVEFAIIDDYYWLAQAGDVIYYGYIASYGFIGYSVEIEYQYEL